MPPPNATSVSSQPLATSVATGKPTAGYIVNGLKAKVPGNISNPSIPPLTTKQTNPVQTAGGQDGQSYKPDPLLASVGVARDPQQIAADSHGAATGPGSPAPGGYTQPTPNQPTTPSLAQNPTFPGAVGQLIQTSMANPNQAAIDRLNALGPEEQQQISQVTNAPGLAGVRSGEVANITTGYANEAARLGEAISKSQAQQQMAQTGLSNAVSAIKRQLGQYGQTFYNPLQEGAAGGQDGGTQGGIQLTGAPAQDVSNLAQSVVNGTLNYPAALSQLSGYGTAVQNQLLPAIQKLKPDFNFNLSASSAQTQATGQQIQTAADSANKALDTLSSIYSSLPAIQTGGIPFTNSIANYIAGAFGQSQLTQFQTALADARSQLVGVLNSAGGTPTGNEATALSYLPDNMTPAQFQAAVGTAQSPGTVRQLIQQKVGSFTTSGQQNSQPQNATEVSGGNAGGGGGSIQTPYGTINPNL